MSEKNESTEEDNYDASKIQKLEGLEGVRKRPDMYIGDTNERGLHHCVFEIVDNSIDESLAGYCSEIRVNLHGDGSCSVQDNGRGIPVDIHPKHNMPALELVLTNLHAGGKFGKGAYQVSGEGGAIVVDFSGDVQVKAPAPPELVEKQYGPDWEDPKKEQILTAGYALRTREGSNIRLLLTNGTLVTLSPVSEARILTFFQETIAPSNQTFKETTDELSPSMVKLELSLGEMIVETKKLDKGSTFDINGPVAVAGIRGTAFRLRASEGEQALEVLRGQVDCQQGSGRITSVIGGQANTASKEKIEDPAALSEDAGEAIEQTLTSLREQIGGLTVAQLSEKHEAANPPLRIYVPEEGFEAELRRMIRRPRGPILHEDYDRVGYVSVSYSKKRRIKDIQFVEKLRNLTSIYLDNLPICDLQQLINCQKLNTVQIAFTKNVANIEILESLPNLSDLILNKVEIKYWSFFKRLNNLKRLSVRDSEADILAISQLKTLRALYLDSMKGFSLDQFQGFKHLEYLYFRDGSSDDDLHKLRAMLPNTEVVVKEN